MNETPDATTGRIAIGVATYKRPELLRNLLLSLSRTASISSATVYVVDNDSSESGRAVCEIDYGYRLVYSVESTPGIAAARNAFLDRTDDEDFLIFIDDDEFVDGEWLSQLRSAQAEMRADVVWGPVIPVFPDSAPEWAVKGGFFDRARHPTGHELKLAATNNVIVSRTALEKLVQPRFSESFSETGGSDSDLFHRMYQSGAKIRWCDEAVVREHVPVQRMTWAWVSQRAERTGNVRARLLISDGRRLQVFVEGVARVGVGLLRTATCKVRRRVPTAREINTYRRGLGMLRALRGSYIREYKR